MGRLGDLILGTIDKVTNIVDDAIFTPEEVEKDNNTVPSDVSHPPNLDGIDPDDINHGIINVDGEFTGDVPLYNGAFYDKETGKILGDDHGPNGKYDKDKYDKDWVKVKDPLTGKYVTVGIWKKKKGSGGGGGGRRPSRPAFIEFDTPMPTFTSDVKNIEKYFYYFGLDHLKAIKCEIESISCFLSQRIDIRAVHLEDEDYIELEADFATPGLSSIEFYIIDEGIEAPILPKDIHYIKNEKLFYNLPLRFHPENEDDVIVKKNGSIIEVNYKTVIFTPDFFANSNDLYTVDYTPQPCYKYYPTQPYLQIKAILRTQKKATDIPYIYALKIAKYSEQENSWFI